MNNRKIGTKCVQGGYTAGNGEPRQVPIIQSTTFKYTTGEAMGKLFDLEASGYFYSRLQNPTCDTVAAKICEMEGGSAAMLTSSGMAANFLAVFNIRSAFENVKVVAPAGKFQTVVAGLLHFLRQNFKGQVRPLTGKNSRFSHGNIPYTFQILCFTHESMRFEPSISGSFFPPRFLKPCF